MDNSSERFLLTKLSVKEGDSDSDQQDEYSSQDDSLLNNYNRTIE